MTNKLSREDFDMLVKEVVTHLVAGIADGIEHGVATSSEPILEPYKEGDANLLSSVRNAGISVGVYIGNCLNVANHGSFGLPKAINVSGGLKTKEPE